MEPCKIVLLLAVFILIPTIFAAPGLECPAICSSSKECPCKITSCSEGISIIKNSAGLPINMTALVLSGEMPFNSFSQRNYALSFNASWGGKVSVKVICLDSTNFGVAQKEVAILGLPNPTLLASTASNSSAPSGNRHPPSIKSAEEIQAKISAQVSIQQLTIALVNSSYGENEASTDLLLKAKLAFATGNYSGAKSYADEGYASISAPKDFSSDEDLYGLEEPDGSEESSWLPNISIDPMMAFIILLSLAIIGGIKLNKKKNKPSSGIIVPRHRV